SGSATLNLSETGWAPAGDLVLYLSNPGGDVLSAIDTSVTLDGRALGRKPSGSGQWFLFLDGTPGQPNGSTGRGGLTLSLNEMQRDGALVERVELFNSGEGQVDLAGLYLSSVADHSNRIPLSGVIGANGFVDIETAFPVGISGEVTVYLVTGNGVVIDADLVDFAETTNGAQVYPDGGAEWYLTSTFTPGASNDPGIETSIVIHELMVDPPSNSRNQEFIELYNRGTGSIDLSGWELDEGVDYVFPPGTQIGAGDYLVVGAEPDFLQVSNALGPWEGTLRNKGERVRLVDALGNLVDQVDYRIGGRWPELAGGDGSSLEMTHPDMDNDFPNAWGSSDESDKTTFQSYSLTGTFRQLRTEGSSSDYKELHFHLVGDAHVILRNIRLQRNGSGSNLLTNGTRRSTNGSSSSGWLCQGTHHGSDFTGSEFHLRSTGHGDNRPNRVEIDVPGLTANNSYTLRFEARWVSGKPRLIAQTWDHSIGGTFLLPVAENPGTPGEENSVAVNRAAPQVASIEHRPVVPTSSDPVRILARVEGSLSPSSVTVWHRADSSGGNQPWSNSAMNDAGNNGDEKPGDGIYTTTLTSYQSNRSIAQFYVEAVGANGALTRMPKQGRDRPAMWVVDNQSIDTDLRTERFVISAYDLDALTQNGESSKFSYNFPRLSNQYFNMTFISNEEKVIYGCEARKSGSPWTRSGGSNLSRGKWKTPPDQPFRGRVKTSIDDDASNADRRHNNRLPRYWLYLLGHPVNENEFIQHIINGGGANLRESVEPVANDFLDRNFEDGTDGELYRIDDEWWFTDNWDRSSRNADWGYKDTDEPTRYHTEWMKRSRETDYDYSALISMIKTVSDVPFTEAQAERIWDPDLMNLNAAVRGYMGDWDTFTLNRGKNGYLYRKSTDGRFMLLHWDSDLAFRSTSERFLGNLSGVRNYFTKPYNDRLFNHYLNELTTKYTRNSTRLQAWFDAEEASSRDWSMNRGKYEAWFSGREGPA
ncbi:MAG: lamin tail domain-containing protein, partial [Verrucomicrobiota bacterium]